ncbi:MAG TPA: type III PLP-dependent enzyme [Hyphomicrobiaceae bacterium]|nr:type III PLP-dependent enzyme [Hyphomicrobiaceae bacterium]
MERFSNAVTYLGSHRPERPVFGMRPEAAGRAARWFLQNFPGDVAYAYKANSHPLIIGSLYGAGIRHFDVASLPELEDAATIPGAILHFMHPVKSRNAIRRAYSLGVRSFSLDSEEELDKIVEETNGARDLALSVRLAVPAKNSRLPLERKFGIAMSKAAPLLLRTRQAAAELGLTFHVGSQTVTPDAYTLALAEIGKLIKRAGVVVDKIDVGGGFPSRYSEEAPTPLQHFVDAIKLGFERLPVKETCKLMCEPGRALVAEAESLIVRIDARRGNELFINDGGYGALFDAAHLGFAFPVRLVTGGPRDAADLMPFELWGPTCDSVDRMKGPFMLPDNVREGDYLELGNLGAYGRAIAGKFNGYGQYDEVLLGDEPMYSMYRGSNATAVPDPEGVR